MLKIFHHRYFAARKFEFWLLPVCFSQTLSRHLGSTLPTSNCLLVLLQGSLDVFCIEKVVASLPDLLGVLKILGNKQKNKRRKKKRKKKKKREKNIYLPPPPPTHPRPHPPYFHSHWLFRCPPVARTHAMYVTV